jgi:uncharacterized glyoxalase superfamily protein PhnB
MGDTVSPNIFPTLRYRDASAALEWLVRAFGFEEKAVFRDDDGAIQHAELRLGTGIVMFGPHRPAGWLGGKELDPLASPGIYIVVNDPEAHHDRAVAAGAEIVRELTDEDYGSREYSARDLDGYLWSFGTYDPYAS